MRSRSLREAFAEEPDPADVEAALSARYAPGELERRAERAHEEALAAGFDPLPEPEPVVREAPPPGPPLPPIPKYRIDYPVVAVTRADFPGWGKWLVDELCAAWPTFRSVNQYSVMQAWTAAPDYHFIRTSNSAALSISVPHPLFGGTTVVRGMFCWSRFPQEDRAELHLVQLHRHTIEWARSRKALHFEFFEKSDLGGHRADFFLRPVTRTRRFVETR
jgi:hypothetical protein